MPRILGSDAPDALRLGRFYDSATQQVGAPMRYGDALHVLVFGPNGSGKGTRLLVPNLLQCEGKSIFVIDPKGELAAITAPYRRKLGDVVILNPFGVLTNWRGYGDLKSDGFNPLANLDPSSPSFNSDAALLAAALVQITGNDPHWDGSARALVAALIMYAVIEARAGGRRRVATMRRVRELLTMASGEGYGLPKLAEEMAQSAVMGLRNKAAQFTEWNREIAGIASSAKRQTEAFDDDPVMDDLDKNGFDPRAMKRRPMTVYVILPPEMMERQSKWLRLVLSAAIQGVLRARQRGEPGVLFMMDEFAALGHLEIIETVWALVRGYGIQLMPVLQDMSQLRALYKERWETFIGNAGVVASFRPNDLTTAKWLSERGGERTVVAGSYNTGQSQGQKGHTGSNIGFSYNQVKVPLMPAHELFGIPDGHLVLGMNGLSSLTPAYAPGYWQIKQCRERARANPYFRG
jgi:type IV secretion system protein VirD4